MHLRTLQTAAGTALLAVAAPLTAQDTGLPTAEEYAERAAEAEAAPLFQTHDILEMTLTTDIDWLIDERNDSVEVEGTVVYTGSDGSEVTAPVQVRTRGEFRRDKRNCNFPPLRLNFPTGRMEGTTFETQDKVKLVTPCHDSRGAYQNYVYDEYLAYRVFNLITPVSHRVRLVRVTYVDINDEYDTRTKVGFLIESDDAMAARNHARLIEATQFHPARMEPTHAITVALFNYMIANSDWSPVFFHNSNAIQTEDGRYLTVPYDFDWSGVVNARYAAPDPTLPIRNVRQRLYRGFCRDELVYPDAVAPFAETRDQVRQLYYDFAALGLEDFDEDDAEDAWDYYEDFYKIVDDAGEFDKKIARECRSMVTG